MPPRESQAKHDVLSRRSDRRTDRRSPKRRLDRRDRHRGYRCDDSSRPGENLAPEVARARKTRHSRAIRAPATRAFHRSSICLSFSLNHSSASQLETRNLCRAREALYVRFAVLARAINSRTLAGSLRPGEASTPETTSTPQGSSVVIASATFAEFSPPAATS